MRTFTLLIALAAIGSSVGCDNRPDRAADKSDRVEQPDRVSPTDPDPVVAASIGEATMKSDGTLVLQLRAEAPGGGSGDALIEYRPTDPDYQKTLDHIGGLEAGQSKPVPPWPDGENNRE